MNGLRLDPGDGRSMDLRGVRRFSDVIQPEPLPEAARFGAMLDEAIARMWASYLDQLAVKAEELAAHGFGLEGVEFGIVSDPDDLTKVSYRGMFRIVPLDEEGAS